jgi:hypothetical protein
LRESSVENLSVSVRTLYLLKLVETTTGQTHLDVRLKCRKTGCGQAFELEVLFAELRALPAGTENRTTAILPLIGSITLRAPTGSDQLAWRKESFLTAQAALVAMARRLTQDPERIPEHLTSEQLVALDMAMEEADPLMAFTIQTSCPHCGGSTEVGVDIEALALDVLAEYRKELLRDVHALAKTYGWTEAEVLGVPRGRRMEYKRRIEGEPV